MIRLINNLKRYDEISDIEPLKNSRFIAFVGDDLYLIPPSTKNLSSYNSSEEYLAFLTKVRDYLKNNYDAIKSQYENTISEIDFLILDLTSNTISFTPNGNNHHISCAITRLPMKQRILVEYQDTSDDTQQVYIDMGNYLDTLEGVKVEIGDMIYISLTDDRYHISRVGIENNYCYEQKVFFL